MVSQYYLFLRCRNGQTQFYDKHLPDVAEEMRWVSIGDVRTVATTRFLADSVSESNVLWKKENPTSTDHRLTMSAIVYSFSTLKDDKFIKNNGRPQQVIESRLRLVKSTMNQYFK